MRKKDNHDLVFIDERTDWYISSILQEAKKKRLNSHSANILNYVVYLLLNKNFQRILHSFRLSLEIPVNGFSDDEDETCWEAMFRKTVRLFHKEQAINIGTKFLLTEIEKTLGRKLEDHLSKKSNHIIHDISHDAVNIVSEYIFKFLKLQDTKNTIYWRVIIKELLTFDSPKEVIKFIYRWSSVFGSQSLSFIQELHRCNMSIILYPDTTIQDIEELIKRKKKEITTELNKLKEYSRENTSKVDDIERDYFIYKTYTSHESTRKRDENINQNFRKEEIVADEAEKSFTGRKQKKIIDMKWEPMRKIVSRMNKRIEKTVLADRTKLDKLLQPIST